MASRKEIIFITTNAHKLKEIRALAARSSRELAIEHLDYAYPELQLDTIEAVARASANFIREKITIMRPFFIEDSGLSIPALKGFPGPFSAFVFKTIGNDGILRLMADMRGEERRATFKTVVAFCEASRGEPILFVGTVEGRIAAESRGSGGFGYDPIFEVNGKTFGEMSTEEKNAVSHRSRAVQQLLAHLSSVQNPVVRPIAPLLEH
jgi:XTP/dITP diphosphohydrolase